MLSTLRQGHCCIYSKCSDCAMQKNFDSSKINSGGCGVLQGTFITPLIISTKLLGQLMLLECPLESSIRFSACSSHLTCQLTYDEKCLSFCSIGPSACCSFSVSLIRLSAYLSARSTCPSACSICLSACSICLLACSSASSICLLACSICL